MNNGEKRNCSICKIPHFERNNYYHGKLLTSRDFFAEQCYFNEKRWLVNRMINGWGVVCGCEVLPGENPYEVKILPGLAIDCCGREILVCDEKVVKLEYTEDECQESKDDIDTSEYYIGLEFWDCKTEEVQIGLTACKEEAKCEFNRIRDYYKVHIFRPSEVDADYSAGFCPLDEEEAKDLRFYVCEKMIEGCPECPELPRNQAVILAKVTVDKNGNVDKIECCPYRRQVYGNKMLFDLINCYHGDLPHITGINWTHNKSMSWSEFIERIKRDSKPDKDGQGFQVTFDKDIGGVDENTFLLMVKFIDTEGGYIHYWQIPGEVEYVNDNAIFTATFKVNQSWYKDILGYSFIHGGADFQIIIKGDHIVDKDKNRALDANYNGRNLPSGNGTQGGDFFSWFSVGAKETSRQRKVKK